MYLLFANGKRPSRAALKAFEDSQNTVFVSHDPFEPRTLQLASLDGEKPEELVEPLSKFPDLIWVELLSDGLTFDLQGLNPGSSCAIPEALYKFDLETLPSRGGFEAIRLLPGSHLAGAQHTMPVAKGLMSLARDLIHYFDDLAAVVWPPSQSAIGRRFFESSVTAWTEGGPFPALGLTAFREVFDGAIESVGLKYWIEKELRIEQPLVADKVQATRLGVRLINQLVMMGGIEESERMIAPDGTRLILRVSPNKKFIRVSNE